jgi:predicted unusual protein kinase regulating ubiquinone biosynthesis (AarF/ABC1/UbiB family)
VKELDRIPVTKVQRATRFLTTGARIGTNYLKHYSKKIIDPNRSEEQLHEDNAADIYSGLSELKGGALKVAQMLSMDRNLLPVAYQQKFAMAQYSAPPLSYPLVVKTFRQHFGKAPEEIFDSFSHKAVNAASMGQVHQATLAGKKYAVKIQYPGISDSIKSDLAMVKPIALTMFKLNPVEYDEFMQEIAVKMLEETDYELELRRSMALSESSRHMQNVVFPRYYPEYSSARILTMDWLDGRPLSELLNKGTIPSNAADLAQTMWDFYNFQMHVLRAVHADPHPGNFLLMSDGSLGIIDFGCVKEMTDDFYQLYFQLQDPEILTDEKRRLALFEKLRFVYPEDSPRERDFFVTVFTNLVELLCRPFRTETFDFADNNYFEELYSFGQKISMTKELRESRRARGVRDAVYINRTYFGLYTILHDLKARVTTGGPHVTRKLAIA